jgi:hypothetical protein
MKTGLQVIGGLAIWIAVAATVWMAIDRRAADGAFGQQVAPSIWEFWTTPTRTAVLELPAETTAAVSDPIFAIDADGRARHVGEVRRLLDDKGVVPLRRAIAARAEVALFPNAPPLGANAEVTYHATSDSLNWVLETLLTADRKAEISADLAAAWAEHQDEILGALQPVIEASLNEGVKIAEEELPKSFTRHKPQWQALAARYQKEIVDQKLLPLAKDEIWPILQRRTEPVLNEVGQEVWSRVSLWRFGWRIAYDKTLLPDKKLTEKEWDRFVENEMKPVIEAHVDELVAAVKDTVRDAAENPAVRETVRAEIIRIVDDPEFRKLVRITADETILQNPRMRAAMKKHWTGPQAQAALRLAAGRMEPVLRRTADRILGTRADGVSPEFAAVLRNQILQKDRRWFLLMPGETPANEITIATASDQPPVLVVRRAESSDINPFVQSRASAPHGIGR